MLRFALILPALLTGGGTLRAQTAFLPTKLPRASEVPAWEHGPAGGPYVNADLYYDSPGPVLFPATGAPAPLDGYGQSPALWDWQILPDGLVWHSYLAGPKEPRLAAHLFHEKHDGWLLDPTLGGRVALLRYGTNDPVRPEGWELQVEGAAFPRVNLNNQWDLVSADFRAGVPLVYGRGKYQFKFGYFHLSSHLGDELLIKHPRMMRRRINYSRDSLQLAVSYFLNPSLRLYAEADWAFYADGGAEPWGFQFGFSYSPADAVTILGAPFLAAHGQLREEQDFGGNLTVQTGWQWSGPHNKLFRAGFHYLVGHSSQYQFYRQNEQQLGFGLWYDY
jgi:hypothetical protein